MQINPYLAFDGTCARAFRFYAGCLGGTVEMMQTYGGSPMAGHAPAEHADRIMHARLRAGDAVLMGADTPPGQAATAPAGFCTSLQVDDPADAERIFGALAEGGRVTMPIAPTFWAERFGMLVDQFGVPWMVNCEGSVGPADSADSPTGDA